MALLGQLEPPTAQLEVDQRPGVSGTEILHIGSRGVPFTLVSRVDCSSYSAAQDQYQQYKTIILASDSGASQVIQSDYDSISGGYLCRVLGIRLLSIRQARVIVGGLQNTSGAILECEWTLISISQIQL